MKKYLIGTAVVIILVVIFVAVPRFQKYGLVAKRAEGRVYARKISAFMTDYKTKNGNFPGEIEINSAVKNEMGDRYKWGVGKAVATFCPDCMITPDSYKIVVFGNLDKDPENDVLVIMNDVDDVVVVTDDSI